MTPYRAVPARPTLRWWQSALAVLPEWFVRDEAWYRQHVGGRWYRDPQSTMVEYRPWRRAKDGRCPATWAKHRASDLRGASIDEFIKLMCRDALIDEHRARCTCEVYP